MEWNCLFSVYEINVSTIHVAQIHRQPYHVPSNRFRKWCTWTTIPHVVRFCTLQKSPSNLNASLTHISFLFLRFPFDSNTPIGFFVAFILQCIVLWHTFFFCVILVSFGVSSFLFCISHLDMDISVIHHINEMAKVKKNRLAAVNEFAYFIEFQSAAKQLSFYEPNDRFMFRRFLIHNWFSHRLTKTFSDLYQPIIAILFIWCIGTLCAVMLMFQMGTV